MIRAEVKPELLRWARERARYSVEALTARFPKLDDRERGEAQPTLKQLEAFARATYTPLGFLSLSTRELSTWSAERGEVFFVRPDASVLPELAAVSAWASSQAYTPAAVSTFLQVADYYLVPQARSGRHTIVTHEVPRHPRAGSRFQTRASVWASKFMTPYEMLRSERARFVLGPRA